MRTPAVLLGATLLGATIVPAQTQPGVEVGTTLGVTLLSQFGASTTYIGIPVGLGPVAQPSIYATIFASRSLTIEPQLGFARVSSSNGNTRTSVDVAAQLGYWFTPGLKESAYLAASLAYQDVSSSFSIATTEPGLGGEIGYHVRVGSGFAIRFTARYRRWFGQAGDFNEFGVAMGLGGVIH